VEGAAAGLQTVDEENDDEEEFSVDDDELIDETSH
jgi:hypothetical protein